MGIQKLSQLLHDRNNDVNIMENTQFFVFSRNGRTYFWDFPRTTIRPSQITKIKIDIKTKRYLIEIQLSRGNFFSRCVYFLRRVP